MYRRRQAWWSGQFQIAESLAAKDDVGRVLNDPDPATENLNCAINAMQITQQLAIFLENKPGTLARVCDALSAAKVNIYAITVSDTIDHSVIRLVVSDPRRALVLFEEHGTLVVEDDVLMVEGDNRPGSLAKICHRLSEAKINIEYCYSATSPEAKKGLMILRVSDPRKALKALNI
jgi:hypothetical protein